MKEDSKEKALDIAVKVVKTILTLIYVFGIVCVLWCSFLYFRHSTTVESPDAMLPFMEYERGAWALMVGVPLLTISSMTVIAAHEIEKWKHRLMCFIPSVYSVIVIAIYWVTET